ncbi:MAG: ABC-type phosphate uptake system substrate-binding component PstS [Actinomycetota bacterium]|jgi:phosphate transport system substrate-binding protein
MVLRRLLAILTSVGLAVSLLSAPAFASGAQDGAVVSLGKCSSRNKIAYDAKGVEFKCSISGGGLKWKKTGNKQGANAGSNSSTINTAKYANVSGTIKIDGSSTVAPLTGVAAEAFQKVSKTQITVGISGTGGGQTRFCKGELDIANASAAYSATQRKQCEDAGIKFTELRLATDALSVVVNPKNTWAKCLTVAELKKIWEPGSKVQYWNQVRSDFPRVKMPLFGAGTDSGTFEYFTEQINGRPAKRSRVDYTPTEDDNVTVNGVKRSTGALGYYGFSYYKENTDINKAIAIDGGKGCAEPSLENVLNGSYTPLARPLFIYVNNDAVKKNPAVIPFLEYYAADLKNLAEKAKFLPLTSEQEKKLNEDLAALKKLAN